LTRIPGWFIALFVIVIVASDIVRSHYHGGPAGPMSGAEGYATARGGQWQASTVGTVWRGSASQWAARRGDAGMRLAEVAQSIGVGRATVFRHISQATGCTTEL
jgi:hypothetical protein